MTSNQVVNATLRIYDSGDKDAGRSYFSIDLMEWHRRLQSANGSKNAKPLGLPKVSEGEGERLAAA